MTHHPVKNRVHSDGACEVDFPDQASGCSQFPCNCCLQRDTPGMGCCASNDEGTPSAGSAPADKYQTDAFVPPKKKEKQYWSPVTVNSLPVVGAEGGASDTGAVSMTFGDHEEWSTNTPGPSDSTRTTVTLPGASGRKDR